MDDLRVLGLEENITDRPLQNLYGDRAVSMMLLDDGTLLQRDQDYPEIRFLEQHSGSVALLPGQWRAIRGERQQALGFESI